MKDGDGCILSRLGINAPTGTPPAVFLHFRGVQRVGIDYLSGFVFQDTLLPHHIILCRDNFTGRLRFVGCSSQSITIGLPAHVIETMEGIPA